jgi:asparagine synthase (glutamine-hydrolysing)
MCGIAGIVDFTHKPHQQSVVEAMTRALGRRGPDGHGTLVRGACRFVHARLSIIDLALSHQPMALADRPLSIVYNGELYNYPALRDELQGRGETFATNGDTEVVLRMVSNFGERALPRLDGMFAMGVWNAQEESLLLARDPLGEKPLFYAITRDGTFVFGSEIKALLCVDGVDREPHLPALRQALRFRAVYGDHTLYRGVQQLRPGHLLRLTRGSGSDPFQITIRPFHSIIDRAEALRPELAKTSERELIARGEALFEESVRERLIADVPVGIFLSGGLDSSLLAAVITRTRGRDDPLRSYSVGFVDDHRSELPFAQEVARSLGTDHTEVLVGPADYIRRLEELTLCRDAPVSEPADVAIACMSARAKHDVKVVQTGEGSDEAFAGYPKYTLADPPAWVRAACRLAGPSRIPAIGGWLGIDRRRASVAARALAAQTELTRLAQWFSYVERESLTEWLPGVGWSEQDWSATLDAQRAALGLVQGWTPLARMQALDCLTWLPGNLLERGDRMTMAEGLESRPPFLDKELVAFGLALPDRMKVRGRVGKWIVRRWANDLLPPSVLNRPKWGFRVPLAQWFRGDLRSFARDHLLRSDGLVANLGDAAAVRRILDMHTEGREDLNLTIWTLLTVELWWSSNRVCREGIRTYAST